MKDLTQKYVDKKILNNLKINKFSDFRDYFISTINLIDNIEGDYIECGFGWGITGTLVVDNMISNII